MQDQSVKLPSSYMEDSVDSILEQPSIRKIMINSDSNEESLRVNSQDRSKFSVETGQLGLPKISIDNSRCVSQSSIGNSLTKKRPSQRSISSQRRAGSNMSKFNDAIEKPKSRLRPGSSKSVIKVKKIKLEPEFEVINNVRDEFQDLFRPANGRVVEEEITQPKGGKYKKRSVFSIPEYEPDTVDTEWDKNHSSDAIIRAGHPLRKVLSCQKTWKNVAPPVKDVFNQLIDFMVEKDLERHKWKRRLKRRNSMN